MEDRLSTAAGALWNFQQSLTGADGSVSSSSTSNTATVDPDSYQNLEKLFADLSLDDGLAIQRQLHLRHEGATGSRAQVGWKVGLTSERARQAVGSDTRPFGHVTKLFDGLAEASSHIPTRASGKLSLEPEMCFEIGGVIAGPNVDPADVPAQIAGVYAGYEVNEQRLRGVRNLALLVADNLTNWAIVKGSGKSAAIPSAAALDEMVITTYCNSEQVFSCTSSEVVDNPFESIAALAATLHRHNLRLEPGQLVITGAYSRFELEPGQVWRTEYSGLGMVEIGVTR